MQITGEQEALPPQLRESLLAAMAMMPEGLRLSLWLHYCLGLELDRFPEVIQGAGVGHESAPAVAMAEFRAILAARNVIMSVFEVQTALMTIRPERAPGTLIEKIGQIWIAHPRPSNNPAGLLARNKRIKRRAQGRRSVLSHTGLSDRKSPARKRTATLLPLEGRARLPRR